VWPARTRAFWAKELCATLTLDMALTMPRTAEATRVQASTIKQGVAAPVHQLKTPAAKPPMGKPATQHQDQQRGRPAARWHQPGTKTYGCWNCQPLVMLRRIAPPSARNV
jgi:hypothetical protein